MEHTKKTRLVSEEQYQQFQDLLAQRQEEVSPVTQEAARLHQNMQNVMLRQDIPPDVKNNMYQDYQKRYWNVKREQSSAPQNMIHDAIREAVTEQIHANPNQHTARLETPMFNRHMSVLDQTFGTNEKAGFSGHREEQPKSPHHVENIPSSLKPLPSPKNMISKTEILDNKKKIKKLMDFVTKNSGTIKYNNDYELVYNGQHVPHSDVRTLIKDFAKPVRNRATPAGAREFGEMLRSSGVQPHQVTAVKRYNKYVASPGGKSDDEQVHINTHLFDNDMSLDDDESAPVYKSTLSDIFRVPKW